MIEFEREKSLILVIVHRPADENAASTDHLFDELTSLIFMVKSHIVIVVDLNIDSTEGIPCANARRLENSMKICGFEELVKGKTRVSLQSTTKIDYWSCLSKGKICGIRAR